MGVNGIYGLSGSGLDIESMVKVGMMSRQSQYDKMQQQYTKNEWTKTAYVDIYSKVQTFNNSTLSQYKMSANMNARGAESSNSAVKVTANASAAAMTHHVNVTNSATNAYLIGENSIVRKGDSQTTTQLKDALFKNLNRSGNSVYYTDDDGETQTAKATDVAFKFTVGDGSDLNEADNTISVTYGELADGYTFNDLTAAVNNLGLTTKATYDSVNDKFSFYNTESGSESGVALKMGNDTTTEFFNALGLKKSENGELAEDALTFTTDVTTGVSGTNANVSIDGMAYDISSNKLTVNGVTYDFTGAAAGTTSTVNVTQDTDKIIDKVKSFVEDYNKLLQSLTDVYNEKPNKNYKPLTESQREQMKDEQIEKWEEKAKAGMLYHDQTLGKLIDQMREAVATPIDGVAGKYNSIFAIGISTTGTKGQLVLDEDKLKAALSDDPDAVYNVFAKLDTNDMDNASKSGIAQRLGDVFMTNMKSIRSRSGTDLSTNDDSELSRLMRELQTKMSNFKSMMAAFEDKLYKKYDAMETALARLGTQLNYVSSAFG